MLRNCVSLSIFNPLFFSLIWSEVYLEPSRTTKMELFAKIVNSFILDVQLGSEYASVDGFCKSYCMYWNLTNSTSVRSKFRNTSFSICFVMP